MRKRDGRSVRFRLPAYEPLAVYRVIQGQARASTIGNMKVWLIFLLVAGAGFAQTPAKKAPAKKAAVTKNPAAAEAAPSKWPVETLTVEGNHNYTGEQVLGVAGLKVGQMAGKAEFEAARDRLTATGMFETVG